MRSFKPKAWVKHWKVPFFKSFFARTTGLRQNSGSDHRICFFQRRFSSSSWWVGFHDRRWLFALLCGPSVPCGAAGPAHGAGRTGTITICVGRKEFKINGNWFWALLVLQNVFWVLTWNLTPYIAVNSPVRQTVDCPDLSGFSATSHMLVIKLVVRIKM